MPVFKQTLLIKHLYFLIKLQKKIIIFDKQKDE